MKKTFLSLTHKRMKNRFGDKNTYVRIYED